MAMLLRELLRALPLYQVLGNIDIDIHTIVSDSHEVQAGSVFVALVGHRTDGHEYVEAAINNGAVAIVVQHPQMDDALAGATQIIVRDTRRALAMLADKFYAHPSHSLHVIGVTGTNGKTTTTHILRAIFEEEGYKTGLIGTVSTIIGDTMIMSKNTTPESLTLQQTLAQMHEAGCHYAIMEVSSHSLIQGRVRGVRYGATVFTNLSQDHLDYHHSMEQYRHAKGLLFTQMGNAYEEVHRPVILNADDPASAYYEQITAAPIITYGIEQLADVRARDLHISDSGIRFWLDTWCGSQEVVLQLTGRFNVYNSLAAIAVALHQRIPLANVVASIAKVRGVDGRMERVDGGQSYTVLVDYAHTPDSLANVLTTIRQFAKGDVITVVGCGGDRDRSKRPIMARVAAIHSEHVIFTSDNPRHEDPQAILMDMVAGLSASSTAWTNYEVIVDRKSAIEQSIALAKENDVLLIAGKGHETYQDFGDMVIHFDDRIVALEAIRRRERA